MLAAVARAYLDIHDDPYRPHARLCACSIPLVWMCAGIEFFTIAKRDQIDIQAWTILARCAAHVRGMESLEKCELWFPHSFFTTPA